MDLDTDSTNPSNSTYVSDDICIVTTNSNGMPNAISLVFKYKRRHLNSYFFIGLEAIMRVEKKEIRIDTIMM